MAGPLTLAEKMPGTGDIMLGENAFLVKPTEIKLLDPLAADAQGLQGVGGATLLSPPPSLTLSDGVLNDTVRAPLDLNIQPVGVLAQFADFSDLANKIVDVVTHTQAEDIYDGIISGSLNLLQQAAPNFGGLGRLVEAGFDIFSGLKIPNSTALFPYGQESVVIGKGSKVGHDKIASGAMSANHVKISEGGTGLKIEDVSGQTANPLWVGEKVPGTETYKWTKVVPGQVYETRGDGMAQIAVGPIALDGQGQPKNFQGAVHLGINNQSGLPRIFHME